MYFSASSLMLPAPRTLCGTQSRTVLSRPIGEITGIAPGSVIFVAPGAERDEISPTIEGEAASCWGVGLYCGRLMRQTIAPVVGWRTASMDRNARSTRHRLP